MKYQLKGIFFFYNWKGDLIGGKGGFGIYGYSERPVEKTLTVMISSRKGEIKEGILCKHVKETILKLVYTVHIKVMVCDHCSENEIFTYFDVSVENQ